MTRIFVIGMVWQFVEITLPEKSVCDYFYSVYFHFKSY